MEKRDFRIFKKMPELITDNLKLRKLEVSDLEDVFEYASDPSVSEFLMWHPHESREYTEAYLKYLQKLYRKGKFYDWGVETDGKLIGTAGFTSINLKENSAEIGYVLNSGFWGRGIASEAVSEILKFGFLVLKVDKIRAVIISENERSARLLLRFDFKEETDMCDKMLIKGAYRNVKRFYINKDTYLMNKN